LLISSTNVSTGVLSTSFPNLTHKHQSIICHRLLPLLRLHYHRLLQMMLRYRQLLPLLRLRHHYHYDDSDDHNDSSFYVRTRTADLTSLS
jgi:Na+/H+ antiporter NhaB